MNDRTIYRGPGPSRLGLHSDNVDDMLKRARHAGMIWRTIATAAVLGLIAVLAGHS